MDNPNISKLFGIIINCQLIMESASNPSLRSLCFTSRRRWSKLLKVSWHGRPKVETWEVRRAGRTNLGSWFFESFE
jgi:hypothetical protein